MADILTALDSPDIFGDSFIGDSWQPWRAVLAGAFAIPMDDDRLALFKRLAGDRQPPSARVRELTVVAGRRTGKTHVSAAIAAYLATIGCELDGTLSRLAKGERGVISYLACDRKQAAVAMNYCRALLESSPILSRMIVKAQAESIELSNGVVLEIGTASYRSIRGRTLICCLADEVAFWRDESSTNPAKEIYRAALPALSSTNGMMILISSPYSRAGLLWERYRNGYGNDGDCLVIRAPTALLNCTLDKSIIDDALADDPEAARSEWLAEFRTDLASFIPRETVEECVRPEPLEIPFNRHCRYYGFADASGGGRDEYSYAVAHREPNGKVVIDCLRARRGKPAEITSEAAACFKSYGLRTIFGDRYSGSWVADEFAKWAITYRPVGLSKSDLYREVLPLLNQGMIDLPPDQKMIGQFASLERRTSASGKDSIDHPSGSASHDDRCNAAAGAAWICKRPAFDVPIHVEFAI